MKKRYLRFGAFAALFVIVAAWVVTAGGVEPPSYVPKQVIIKLDPATPVADAQAVRSSLRATVKTRFESIGAELWVIDGISVTEAVKRFKDDPRVDYIEPNYIVHTLDLFPNDPRFNEQWGMHNTGQTGGTPDADIDAPEAWSLGTGNTVLVGVIDTGCDYNHVDLAANIFVNPGEIAGNGIDDDLNGFIDDVHGWDFVNHDNNPMDDHGHGTHTSGTVAAIGNNGIGVTGVCWSARILPLKFLDAGGFGSTSDAILAVQYATMMHARLTSNSWGGGGFSQGLFDAIAAAGAQGILFVAAAGNASSNNDNFPNFPSNYDLPNIIAVASTDDRDQLSGFSNFGLNTVDLGAPGTDILSTFPNNTYGTISGTSMATPHVSGACALVWSSAPELTGAEVKDFIMSNVDVIPALQGRTVTGGRLNIYKVMSSLDDIPPGVVNDLAVQSTGSTTALLGWTATGDDGGVGTARTYDLRFSTSPIDASNFDSATPVGGTPAPQAAGSAESFEVTGLDYNTTYYFALVVADEQTNRGDVSNSPNGTTLGAPHLEYAPVSFSSSLLTGGTETQTLTIQNTGEGTLDFSFPTGALQTSVVGGVSPSLLPSWLHANPASGRVPAGQSTQVHLVFDATGLYGGDYNETVMFATNDHTQESAPLYASLHVTSAPDVVTSPLELDFGVRFIGTCSNMTLVIQNRGTSTLSVSGISVINPDFSVASAGFSLGVGETRDLVVSFCPTTEASGRPKTSPRRSDGIINIATDDPDHPVYKVKLFGEGAYPPVILVNPTTLSEDLFTGGSATHPLSIMNDGASDLEFSLAIEDLGSGARLQVGTAGTMPDSKRDITPAGKKVAPTGKAYGAGHTGAKGRMPSSTAPVITSANDLQILLLASADVSEMQGFLLAYSDVAVVDVFDGGSATPTLETLSAYDAVILINNFPFSDSEAVGDVLADYVDAGGGVIMTLASFIDGWDIRGRFASGGYYPFTLGSGPLGAANLSNFNASHPIMAGVTAAMGDLLGATTVVPGAEWVADWDNGQPCVATLGDHVVGVNAFVADGGFWSGDVALILHNAALWSAGASWLTADPTEGVIQAGNSLDVSVTFDAAGLNGGNYAANLRIASNDPITPEVVVPASLHVTGAPDIESSATAFAYGQVFIGGVSNKTLVLSNEGTDMLHISSIASSHPDYSVDVSSANLAPGAAQNVVVSYSPTSTGVASGTLSITSDDPDEGVLAVSLDGEGILPPIISVAPTSLEDSLFTGETSTHHVTISNSGASNLTFEIGTEEIEGLHASVRQTLSIPRSSGDFPHGTHAPSATAAPAGTSTRPRTASRPQPQAAVGSSFATDASFGQALRFNLSTPEVLNFVGEAPQFIWAGDFGGDDSFAYAVNDGNQFVQIDTTTGAQTFLGNIVPFGDEIWSGMAFDPTDGAMYAVSTDVFASSLYLIDVTVPSATRIGAVGFPGLISLAVDDTGAMFSHDIVTDELVSIDKTTGIGSAIGSLGFDANFGQGMAFDKNSGQLYLAAFNNSTFQAELRVADRTTGATALVGVLGADVPGSLVQLGWLGIPGLGGARWLLADPNEGVVPPGTSMDIEVTFNAAGLYGGDYNANLVIANNDPLSPEVRVAAHLHVTGAPDIAVTETALDYGPVFIGGHATKTIKVKNAGTDVLTVTSISTDHGDYSVDVPSVVLAPATSQDVVVSYAPTSVGPSTATLSIVSDDPDEALLTVALSGTGVEPPIIGVNPTSFAEDLFTGENATHTLTISNTGASDLTFDISAEDVTTTNASTKTLLLRGRPWLDRTLHGGGAEAGAGAGTNSRGTHSRETIAAASRSTNAQDPVILVIQDFSAWGVDMATFIYDNFGFTATVINSNQVATHDFSAYDLIITCGDQTFNYYNAISNNVAKFEDYVSHGGVVQYQLATQGDDVALVGGAQINFGDIDNFNDIVTPSHPIVAGLSSPLEGNAANHTTLSNLPGSAVVITETSGSGTPTTVEYDFGSGTVIATGMTWEYLYNFGYEAGAMLGNAVAYSLTKAGVGWLDVDPSAGVVPPGGSMDLAVKFDAEGLYGGDYAANLLVDNNDPLNSQVVVAATLHVTGAPDINVSETALDYGDVFLGGHKSKTVVIKNVGTDMLNVSSIASSNGDYSVDVASFSLPPTGVQNVVVTFAPTTVAPISGTLTITSDDPDEGSVLISLDGEGLEAPVISVTPLSLDEDLLTGEVATHTVTISNSGGNNLEFSIKSEETDVLSSVKQTISIPRSSGDFPRGTHSASLRAAPQGVAGHPSESSTPQPQAAVGSAFSTDAAFAQATHFNLNNPEVLNYVGSAPQSIWAGDFGGDDAAFAYAVNDGNTFMQIDTTSGAQTPLGQIVPYNFETWTGMAFDPTSGLMYATSTDIFASSLYVIDVTVPSATRVGNIGFPGIIALAVDDTGAMFAHDIVTDELVSIDKTTGTGTAIGSLGFDANYGQGMAFDQDSGQLYLSAFNNFTFQAELRIADRTTGATALVGVLGQDVPGSLVQLGWLAIPGLGGARWLIADPKQGVVPPGTSMDIAATFDAHGLYGGDYNADLVIANNDPVNSEVRVAAHLHVTGAPDIAVSPTSLDYGEVFLGVTVNRSVVVKNEGTDLLTVSNIAATHPDYSVDVTNFALAPKASQTVTVSYLPTSVGPAPATLTITSDDPDEALVDVTLSATGVEPPVIGVTPSSLSEDLFSGGVATQQVTIDNSAGGSNLYWSAATAFGEDTTSVVASSPIFGTGPVTEAVKKDEKEAKLAKQSKVLKRPAMDGLFEFTPGVASSPMVADGTAAPVAAATSTSLEDILANLNANFASVNSLIPNRFDFFEGDFGNSIGDGGNDMYDGGNFLGTDRGGPIFYSDNVIVPDPATFGPGGRYFTRKYPGLFVMVADMTDVEYFNIFGNLGADGGGNVDGAELAAHVSGLDFRGFVKRVYNAFDPSVNHIILVEDNPAAAHEFATNTDDDYHRAYNLSASHRIYYVLYASANGGYVDNTATLAIMGAFLNALGLAPEWISVSPASGTVPAGGSAPVQVTFDAAGLIGGNYDANLLFASNDPVTPEVTVTTHLHVTGAPDIAVSPPSLDFGNVFLTESSSLSVTLSNPGTDILTVSSIATDHGDYTVDVGSVALAPAASQVVNVTFAPTAQGPVAANLIFTSDDPDEGVLNVPLSGMGVVPTPDIAVSSLILNFGQVFRGGKASLNLGVSNVGTGALVISDITAANPVFSTDITAFSVPAGASKNVVASCSPTANGQLISSITIASNDPDEGSTIVYLICEGIDPPVVSVSPSTLSETLAPGATSTQVMTVSNVGANLMNFSLSIDPPPAVDGGGPDYFGYRWRDSNDADGPAFAWVDCSGGTNVALTANGFAAGLPLGFNFHYYVYDFTTIGAGADGWLSLNGNAVGFPDAVPDEDAYAGAIAPYARDLDPTAATYVRYLTTGVAPNRRFVIEYNNIPDQGGGNNKTFEVILAEGSNSIRFQYLTANNDPVAFGIESPDEVYGLGDGGTGPLYIDPSIVESNYAIEFIGRPAWLSASPLGGSVFAGAGVDVTVSFDASNLEAGVYAARITVFSNDPATPSVEVPVTLTVEGTALSSDVDQAALPTKFELFANHPNPFNPTTTIAYDLPRGVDVHLIVYDVNGRQVVELVNAAQPAGHHSIVWEGRNASGNTVASGVYFYRLKAGDFVQTKKMVMLK